MRDRKTLKRGYTDAVSQHLRIELESLGMEGYSLRELMQVGLMAMADRLKSNDAEETLDYYRSLRILSNASSTEFILFKGDELISVISEGNEDEGDETGKVEVKAVKEKKNRSRPSSTSTSPPVSNTMEKSSSEELEEW